MTDDSVLALLLAELDAIYPLPDDESRSRRAALTSRALNRFINASVPIIAQKALESLQAADRPQPAQERSEPSPHDHVISVGEQAAAYMAECMAMTNPSEDHEQNWIQGHLATFALRLTRHGEALKPSCCETGIVHENSCPRFGYNRPPADPPREEPRATREARDRDVLLSQIEAARLLFNNGDHSDGYSELSKAAATIESWPVTTTREAWRPIETARTHGKPFLVSFAPQNGEPAMVEMVACWKEYEEILGYGNLPALGWQPVPDPIDPPAPPVTERDEK